MNSLVDGLRRDSLYFYASIAHIVGQSLIEVSKHINKEFDREAMAFQQAVCDAIRGTVRDAQTSFISI